MFIESLWSRLWGMEAAQLLGRLSIVRLAFAVAQERPERTSELATAWAKLTTFKLSAAPEVVKCDSRSCSTATTI